MADSRLPFHPPLNWPALSGFLATRGAAGVECRVGETFWRTLRLGPHAGWVCVSMLPGEHALNVAYSQSLAPVLPELHSHLRRLFDLDTAPDAMSRTLAQDPALRKRLESHPGIRVPGAIDGFELALRAVLGQQISVKAASTVYGRIARAYGATLEQSPIPELQCLPPEAERLADCSREELIRHGLTQRRADTVRGLAKAVAHDGLRLAPGVDLEETRRRLLDLPGIGPWTASYIAMRALRDPDAFPEADLGLMKALDVSRARDLLERAERWRPWRAYAAMLLWNSLGGGG